MEPRNNKVNHIMTRRTLTVIALLSAPLVKSHAAEKPNIVFILADDMGYGDVGCYNSRSKIPTPHMDRLASEGMRFTDAHSSSTVCTPSRYGILTGRYCWRSALKRSVLFNYEPPLIERTRMTVASLLEQHGYGTACIGKWHLGMGFSAKNGEEFDFKRPLPWPGGTLPREKEAKIDFTKPLFGGPTELGFDLFYGTASCSTCNVPYGLIEGDRFIDQPTEYYRGRYLEQRSGYRSPSWDDAQADPMFTKRATEFIREAAAAGKPFFVYLAASAPHEPCEEEVIPEFIRGASKAGPRGDMVALVDWMVGQVVGALEEAGVSGNTMILVTSDNGAKPGSYNRYTHGHRSCGELRGFKGSIWEGGHRVPLIVRWPGRVRAGSVSDRLVGLQDFMATVADVLGTELPAEAAEDSISFLPILRGESAPRSGRRDLVHHSTSGVFAIRKGPWKLIIDCDNSGDGGRGVHGNRGTGPRPDLKSQLYNLRDDPFELYNLVDRERRMTRELRELAERYRKRGRSARAGRPLRDAEAGFVSIFDGKSLEGWRVVPEETSADWSVRDGVILGAGSADRLSYLVWRDEDLADFELEFSYRLLTRGNTGVEIRSRVDVTGKRPFEGYHADLGHVGIGPGVLGAWDFHFARRKEPACRRGTRLVIDADGKTHRTRIEGALSKGDVHERQWNDVHIIARGRWFRLVINGKPSSEFTDNHEGDRLERGAIGLQLHDKGMKVEFKDVRLKRL